MICYLFIYSEWQCLRCCQITM